MAPEEVEQSAFGDVARILQVELFDISDFFGIGAWLKFSAAGSEDCEDHEDFQTCKALNWSSGFHSGFEHLALRCSSKQLVRTPVSDVMFLGSKEVISSLGDPPSRHYI